MAANSIVSMLLEGNSAGTTIDMPQYTLECGAALIARECVQELHDIFEVAIVETNEAVLGAYLEGSQDVMESATYGPVFEAAEKKAGQKVLDFLKNLVNRVVAFFKNAADKIVLALNGYEKFYKSKEEQLKKSQALKDCPVIDWNDDRISKLGGFLSKATSDIKGETGKWINRINSIMSEADGAARNNAAAAFTKDCDMWIAELCKSIGIAKNESTELDMAQVSKDLMLVFRGAEKVKRNIDSVYVSSILVKTKDAAKSAKNAQKEFKSAYDDTIKQIKTMTDKMDKEEKKGYTQYIQKAVSTLSKGQSLINMYASVGYRCLIGRASEAKVLANAIIAGKVPGSDNGDGGNNN